MKRTEIVHNCLIKARRGVLNSFFVLHETIILCKTGKSYCILDKVMAWNPFLTLHWFCIWAHFAPFDHNRFFLRIYSLNDIRISVNRKEKLQIIQGSQCSFSAISGEVWKSWKSLEFRPLWIFCLDFELSLTCRKLLASIFVLWHFTIVNAWFCKTLPPLLAS